MYLIADSGSTKTHWALLTNSGQRSDFYTDGINPFFQSEEEIAASVSDQLLPQIGKHLWIGPVENIWFFGAGCTPEKSPVVAAALKSVFKKAEAEVCSDMVGAARAICGKERGIACILGTGSNSCLFDGERIINNVYAGGFILGDEGSGAVLGRLFVSDVLKNQLPKALCDKFYSEFDLSYAKIVERVYKQQFPNRFLAGFAKFINENKEEYPELKEVVKLNFRNFFRRNLLQYDPTRQTAVGFIGSIAWFFRSELEVVAAEEGFTLGRIMQEPMEGLVDYYQGK